MLLHLRLGDLGTQVWFGVATNLAVHLMYGTSLIDSFETQIFSRRAKCRTMTLSPSRYTQPKVKTAQEKPTITDSKTKRQITTQRPVEDGKERIFRVGRQFVLEPFIQHLLLVTTSFTGILTIEPSRLSAKYSLIVAASGVMGVSVQRIFYIHVSNFPRKALCLPRHMAVV